MGSHIRYSDRTPPDFKGIDNPKHDKRTNQYDTTLLYTDHLLRDIYTYAKDHLNLQVMMYCSDHGENMERSHVASKNMTYDMVRIPFSFIFPPLTHGSTRIRHKPCVKMNTKYSPMT